MKNLILKILFVIGIVAILVFFAVGIVKIVPKIVASLGATNESVPKTEVEEDSIQVLTNADELISGESFNLTWKADRELLEKEGTFAITYTCLNDVTFEIVGKNDATKTLICNTPFTLGKQPVEITLRPTLNKPDSLRDGDIIIAFFEEGSTVPSHLGKKVASIRSEQTANGTLATNTTTIENTQESDLDFLNNEKNLDSEVEETLETSTPPEIEIPPTPSTPIPTTPIIQTPADLAVGTPIVTGNVVTFSIRNIGGTPSGAFVFNYTIPGETTARTSPLQPSLNPQEELGATITINTGTPGGSLVVRVNSDNRVSELTQENNVIAVAVGFIPSTPGTSLPPTSLPDIVLKNLTTSKSSFASYETLNVSFALENKGSLTSAFTLEVGAPTSNLALAPSGDGLCALRANILVCSVPPMTSGEQRSYNFQINNLVPGAQQTVYVAADTQNVITEVNESNNYLSTFVSVY